MNLFEFFSADSANHDFYKSAFARFQRILSVFLLALGLVYWAIIVGVIPAGSGPFVDMPTHDKIATIHFAVVDLIAAVGLWMQVAWGNAMWIIAVLSAVVLHGIFAEQFGGNALLIGFSLIALAIFVLLQVQMRRSTP